MQEVLNFLIENPYITVLIAVIIFIVTLVFVVKRIFSFVITLIFLAICILSAYVIIYPESTTNFLKQYQEGTPPPSLDDESSKTVKEHIQDAYETAKDKLQEYKEKILPNEE